MKNIRLSELEIKQIVESFEAELRKQPNITEFTYKHSPKSNKLDEKIKLIFEPIAWFKMKTLIENCKDEIAWHGIVNASEDRKTFTVTEILVYPQTVSGATVTTDEVKYTAWKNALDDDAYNNLRLQGHSHVNMGTSPSSVDTTLYSAMLQTLGNQSYYIFLIMNKKGDSWINIYDLLNNAIYETADISISINGIDNSWYENTVKEHLTTRTYVYKPAATYQTTPTYAPQRIEHLTTSDKKKKETKTSKTKEQAAREKLLNDPFYASDVWPPPSYANNYNKSVFKDDDIMDEYEMFYR